MNGHSQPEPEFTHSSASDPKSPSHASGMFSDSQQFTVTGGTFTNITKNYTAAPSLPPDLRMIPLGDIDLRHQIRVDKLRVDEWGVSNAQSHGRACVRRVHSGRARIDGRKSRVTVAMYQGNSAEEEWRQSIAQYMSLRQICGAASSNGIHATLFNDDLIPLREILDHHQDSHFSKVYIYAHCNQDFTEAFDYINHAVRGAWGYTLWIRRSTGRLCTELSRGHDVLAPHLDSGDLLDSSRVYPLGAVAETITTFIGSLTLEQYHNICVYNLGQYRHFDLSASTTVNVGAVFRCSGNPLEDSVEIAFLPSAVSILYNWTISRGGTGEVMPNGWTRFQSGDVFNTIHVSIIFHYERTWLSQANNIFRRLNIMANFEDYVVVNRIDFDLNFSQTTGDPLEGFLFLCPKEDFRTNPSGFGWPACPAYWSLDPSGVDRLSPEEAMRLGFPSLHLITQAYGDYWDASVYQGLRQFHQSKGFDPYSQDVARHLGYPFFRLSSERDALPWAYVDSDGEDFDADIDSDCDSIYPDDYESESLLSAGDDSADLDFEAESLHYEEDVHDPARENRVPEHTEIANCANHNASGSTLGEDIVVEEMFAPPRSLNILISIQLVLILFFGLSWVYDYICLVRLVRNFIQFPVAQ
ncbi:hypothetical protein MSAN_00120900 [Mycena sanguinolenta]|uniref:Uncharacterized protein n=1 Tax=Mycena sanguinolenta TaxID=230812 RepID=A0A8H6ZDH3_9AGAR|nr:hypothetical protein MSAN_00120900 [Mycena sanguinolenta]